MTLVEIRYDIDRSNFWHKIDFSCFMVINKKWGYAGILLFAEGCKGITKDGLKTHNGENNSVEFYLSREAEANPNYPTKLGKSIRSGIRGTRNAKRPMVLAPQSSESSEGGESPSDNGDSGKRCQMGWIRRHRWIKQARFG